VQTEELTAQHNPLKNYEIQN